MAVAELRELLGALPDRVVVLLDEALRDFADAEERDAALALTAQFPRLIVFRTFSKAWGLAGLRVGYAIGGEGGRARARAARARTRAQRAGQAGALEALRHARGVVAARIRTVAAERTRLWGELAALGVDASPSQAASCGWRPPGSTAPSSRAGSSGHAVIVAPGGPLGDPGERARRHPARRGPSDRLLRALRAELRGG